MKWWIQDGYLYVEKKELKDKVDAERDRRSGNPGIQVLSRSDKTEKVRYRVKLEKLLKEPEGWT